MKVIVLDDDELFLRSIKADIEKLFSFWDTKAEIHAACNIKMLNNILRKGAPDLIFLDIDMPDKSGTDIACELRNTYEGIDIIFLTNREDLVFQSIHYLPFRFIRKSKIDEELDEAISAYVKYYKEKKTVYIFDTGEGKKPILLSSIFYIESEAHYVRVYTKEESICARVNISGLEKELKRYNFIRIQRSYLVNLKYVQNITGKSVMLTCGEELPIKRGSMEAIRRSLFEYRRNKYSGAAYKH